MSLKSLKILFVFLSFTTFTFAQSSNAPNLKGLVLKPAHRKKLETKLANWESYPVHKRKKIRKRIRRLKEEGPRKRIHKRKMLKKRLRKLKDLSPEEKRRLIRNLKGLEDLPKDERKRKLKALRQRIKREHTKNKLFNKGISEKNKQRQKNLDDPM